MKSVYQKPCNENMARENIAAQLYTSSIPHYMFSYCAGLEGRCLTCNTCGHKDSNNLTNFMNT